MRTKLFKTVNIFFYFAITFSFGIQVLTFISTKLDSFQLKQKIHVLRVNFGWVLQRFWRKENSRFAHFHTNSFALICESFAFIRESNALFRESLALFRESDALIRESYALIRGIFALIPYENEPKGLSYRFNINALKMFTFYTVASSLTGLSAYSIILHVHETIQSHSINRQFKSSQVIRFLFCYATLILIFRLWKSWYYN